MLRASNGERLMLRGAQRFLGVSLSVAALAMWLIPIGAGGTAELLSKIMFTLVLGFAGAAFWQAGTPRPAPEIEIDMIRREVRLVRWYGETKSLVTRRRFADLTGAVFEGRDVQLWDRDGELLADITLPDERLARALHHALYESQALARKLAA